MDNGCLNDPPHSRAPDADPVQQLVNLAKASKQPAQQATALCKALVKRRLDDVSVRDIALATWAAGKLARYECVPHTRALLPAFTYQHTNPHMAYTTQR